MNDTKPPELTLKMHNLYLFFRIGFKIGNEISLDYERLRTIKNICNVADLGLIDLSIVDLKHS